MAYKQEETRQKKAEDNQNPCLVIAGKCKQLCKPCNGEHRLIAVCHGYVAGNHPAQAECIAQDKERQKQKKEKHSVSFPYRMFSFLRLPTAHQTIDKERKSKESNRQIEHKKDGRQRQGIVQPFCFIGIHIRQAVTAVALLIGRKLLDGFVSLSAICRQRIGIER